ncbi:hypothetical protein Nepgr_027260 [Nepenthes gracilis]|uniref:Uncharacterized protein n=1 Tax=Nepenthes gracilis TaxID=150966 RepID=A0AAD3T9Q2_NEPGR|nr:hypothetical protein Nepgr_027260 [Nepenthes gracilis]
MNAASGLWLSNPVLNDSHLSEDHVESDCHASWPPIDSYGKSGQLPDSVAEEALPQPEPITTPIAVLKAEPVFGAVIETPALPIADSLALTSPNYPSPVSVPQAKLDLGATRSGNKVELPPLLDSVNRSQIGFSGSLALTMVLSSRPIINGDFGVV